MLWNHGTKDHQLVMEAGVLKGLPAIWKPEFGESSKYGIGANRAGAGVKGRLHTACRSSD